MVDAKLVSAQKCSKANLSIYNYTPKVQFDRLWNEITMQTRGLILDDEMNVIAKPFGKFFNLEEHKPEDIPNLPFDVFEKMDGSLIILVLYNNAPLIATRGSFESDQAKHATNILYTKYQHIFHLLESDKTYLLELIAPQNRIVVNYGEIDDLFLITVIDNKTGKETLPDIGFPMVKQYNGITDLKELKALEETNKEGFVARFSNGFRVKIKFAEYCRLHRLITGISSITIWEYLKDGREFNELLDRVPDEFYNWLTETRDNMINEFKIIRTGSYDMFRRYYHKDKKIFALKILAEIKPMSGILFNIYNGKPIDALIWKMIRPTYKKPFKNEEI